MPFLKQLKIKHWIKNTFVFIPLLVSGNLFNSPLLLNVLFGFFAFCTASSLVYIFNDYWDFESDKLHPVKKNRPLASGEISINTAFLLFITLALVLVIIFSFLSLNSILVIVSYLIINFFYTIYIKNFAILDVISISLGFVMRVQVGVFLAYLDVSFWLLTISFCLSMLLSLGKRKAELDINKKNKTRLVLNQYNKKFIFSLEIVFIVSIFIFYVMYTLFSKNFPGNLDLFSFSSLFVLAGLLRYLQISASKELVMMEDPVELLYKDGFLITCVIFWIFYLMACIYLF